MATAQVIAKAVAEYPCLWNDMCGNDLSAGQCSKLNLENNQIHLWMLSLDGLIARTTSSENSSSTIRSVSPFAPHLSEPLTVADHVRAQKIVDNVRRQHYLGGRAGLRILLSAYTHIAHADLEFGYGNRGKPRLLNAISGGRLAFNYLAFNYTVSKGYALYAFARNREVGVDLEVFPRTIATNRLARRILTKAEQTAWNAIDKPQQNHDMLACWSRKEAYGKVLGVGIRYTMNQVNLFTDLQSAQWCTEVSGLFDWQATRSKPSSKQLRGVQLGLPVAGVASLMYAEHGEQTGRGAMGNEPVLSAFQLHL